MRDCTFATYSVAGSIRGSDSDSRGSTVAGAGSGLGVGDVVPTSLIGCSARST
ncbi:MAG TPA: hypothetical protein VF846_12855 [Thermoanaerobaculia bacterium]